MYTKLNNWKQFCLWWELLGFTGLTFILIYSSVNYIYYVLHCILSITYLITRSLYLPVSSVSQSCLTLCDPMNRSTPGLPVHHQLPQFTETHVHCGEGSGTPLQYSCLENPMDGRAWWATVHGVTKSRTRLSDFTFTFSLSCIGEGNGKPLQCSCLENPRDRGAWWAAIYGVAQSRTQLKWLSSSSSMSIVSVMPSKHLILCCPLLLLHSIFPSIRVFSNESTLHIRWPEYWSFSFNISPSNEYPGLISFRMDWLDLLVVQGTLKSLLQHHSSKGSILQSSAFFTVQLSQSYMTTGKTIALTRRTFVGKVMSLLFNMLSRLVIIFLLYLWTAFI